MNASAASVVDTAVVSLDSSGGSANASDVVAAAAGDDEFASDSGVSACAVGGAKLGTSAGASVDVAVASGTSGGGIANA